MATSIPVLRLGSPIKRELAGGETHEYQVRLNSGDYLHVSIDQHVNGVEVTIRAPDGGEDLLVFDSYLTRAPESARFVAQTPGPHRLGVRSLAQKAVAEPYLLTLEELRPASDSDRARTAAQQAFATASKSSWRGSAVSLTNSLELYLQVLSAWRALGDGAGEAKTLFSLGAALERLGDHDKAFEYFTMARQVQQDLGYRRAEAQSIARLAQLHRFRGEHRTALTYLRQALKVQQTAQDRRSESNTLAVMGAVYRDLGEYQQALDYFDRVRSIRRARRDGVGEAYMLLNMASVYEAIGQPHKALEYYTTALSLGSADAEMTAIGFTGIGAVSIGLGQPAKALDYGEGALALARTLGDSRREAVALYVIGRAHDRLGNGAEATQVFNEALARARSVGDRPWEMAALVAMAHTDRGKNDLRSARGHAEAALAIVESVRTNLASHDLRIAYFASAQSQYEFYIDVLMQLHAQHPSDGHDAVAFEASERARARSLQDLLSEGGVDIRHGVDPALLQREESLRQSLNAAAVQQMRLLNAGAQNEAMATTKQIEAQTAELQEVTEQIRSESPQYANLAHPQPLTLRDIQVHLSENDTLLLEYALGEERSYLWAVTETTLTTYELPKRSTIEAAARKVYELLTARQSSRKAAYWPAAETLSHMLLGPVAAQLGTRRLVIVSDGGLQSLPFAALPVPQVPENRDSASQEIQGTLTRRPLIADHEIVNLPSATTLAVLRQQLAHRQPAAKVVAVLADPVFDVEDQRVTSTARAAVSRKGRPSLPADLTRAAGAVLGSGGRLSRLLQTSEEAEEILALAPDGNGMKAVGFEASRATATSSDLAQYQIVHFATHAFVNNSQPELSGVVLSLVDEQGALQDGFLRLRDIYDLRFPIELIVLSACQTALGKDVKGEGLVGLTRGFMHAGAARVIASLWKVDDAATSALMKHFYRALLIEGLGPAAALRTAQLAVLKEKRWQAPYFWAGFILQGEWKPWRDVAQSRHRTLSLP